MKLESGSAWIAMKRSAEGMKRSGTGMAAAATDIVSTTGRVLSDDPVDSAAVVDGRMPPDLQDSVLDMKRHSYGHLANGRIMKRADMAFESLLDALHPKDKSEG